VTGVWGPQRVGYKLSPYFSGYSMSDSNPLETFSFIASELSERGLLYLHVTEPLGLAAAPDGTVRATPVLRDTFNGALIVNGGYDAQRGDRARRSRSRGLRCALSGQSGSSGSLSQRFRAQHAGPNNVLCGRREGLHRLPGIGLS
jgi:hypothetical protein